jgi:hypothetical protein
MRERVRYVRERDAESGQASMHQEEGVAEPDFRQFTRLFFDLGELPETQAMLELVRSTPELRAAGRSPPQDRRDLALMLRLNDHKL